MFGIRVFQEEEAERTSTSGYPNGYPNGNGQAGVNGLVNGNGPAGGFGPAAQRVRCACPPPHLGKAAGAMCTCFV